MAFVNPNRIRQARLAANMSRADLAFRIREVSGGKIRTAERSVAGWERGEYKPSDGVIPAIAAATDHEISFFYEQDESDDDEEADLLRDLEQLPADLRLRIVRALRARSAT
jgi:transcriptional regulator with XRE-family HTH domain